MKIKKFTDFINNSSTDNSPSFVPGTKNGKTVKSVPSSGAIKLLGSKIGFDMNSIADQLIALTGGTKFIITDIVITNASISLNIASDLEVWTAVMRGGNQIPVSFNLSQLTLASKYDNGFIQGNGNDVIVSNIYASLGIAQGSAATADIYVYGYILA